MVKDRGTADVEFDMDGNAFFMVDDVKYLLEDFLMADDNSKVGYLSLTNTGGISASIDPSGEEIYFEFISL